ncbi:hypothetical protein V2J09_023220 [Rumex salicifolius]
MKNKDENEPELQIGVPTDVRHVAHIGWDGPTTSPPSWMDKFKGDGESAASSPPTQDAVHLRSESSFDESPSKHREKVSRSGDSKTRKKKRKGSSRTSSKPKNPMDNVQETSLDRDLEGV